MYNKLFMTVLLAAICLDACSPTASKNIPNNPSTSVTTPSPSNTQEIATKPAGTPQPLDAILVVAKTPTLVFGVVTKVPLFTVTKASLGASPSYYAGPCLHEMSLSYHGTITVSAAGTVKWHWIVNGATGSVETLVFNAAGMKYVSVSGMVGNQAGTPGQTMSDQGQIYIDSPNNKVMATAKWTMVCNNEVNTPTATLETPR